MPYLSPILVWVEVLHSLLGLKNEQAQGGDELRDELMFDVDADLEADNVARPSPSAPRCSSRRLSFPPRQARSEAYTGEIDDGIKDTHLQHNLKRHPSTQAQKGQVCSYFPSICRFSLCVCIYIYYVS